MTTTSSGESLQELVEWFGAVSTNVTVRVQVQGNHAQVISQSVPSIMEGGQSYAVTVRLRNSGSTTWGSDYFLGSQNPCDNFIWGMNRVAIGATVAPGQQRSVTWTVTAPATPGVYNFQWRVLREFVEWFGDFSAERARPGHAGGACRGRRLLAPLPRQRGEQRRSRRDQARCSRPSRSTSAATSRSNGG